MKKRDLQILQEVRELLQANIRGDIDYQKTEELADSLDDVISSVEDHLENREIKKEFLVKGRAI